MAPSELGAYLRARRARVAPGDTGLPATGRRRVPGLRREEVATLAGVSVDYYVRLEQGRERTPSTQVAEALAAALRLGEDGRRHLFRLAGLGPRTAPTAGDRVEPSLLALLHTWPHNPAVVYNRAFDVVASNAIADVLFHDRAHSRNLMHAVFTDPGGRAFYRDWSAAARAAVAGFRLGHGEAPTDPRLREVLAELLEQSPEFADLWARHDTGRKALEHKRFDHTDVGPLTLTMQTFGVRSAPGQELVVYHAEPGSADSEALARLGALAAAARD